MVPEGESIMVVRKSLKQMAKMGSWLITLSQVGNKESEVEQGYELLNSYSHDFLTPSKLYIHNLQHGDTS